MSKRHAVIFDFDGTLANSLELVMSIYNERAEEFGHLPIKPEDYTELRRIGYRKAMKWKQVKLRTLPKLAIIMKREMHARMGEVPPFEGIQSALYDLQIRGYMLGILTSNDVALVQEFLMRHRFPMFDFIVSEQAIFKKDRALKKILRGYSMDRSRVVYVGDEPRDVDACRRAKVPIVGVSWGLGAREGFLKSPPDVIIDEVGQLVEAVDSLCDKSLE